MLTMKHLDITFDLETLSLESNAAVLQLGAVAWNRRADSPETLLVTESTPTFQTSVDLRTCVGSGFDFDPETVDWWNHRKPDAIAALADGDCYPIEDCFRFFLDWIQDTKAAHQCDTVTLWAQGCELDFPILHHMERKFKLKNPLHYRTCRDARTYVTETLYQHFSNMETAMESPDATEAFKRIPKLPECLELTPNVAHHSLSDALSTTWAIWWTMHRPK